MSDLSKATVNMVKNTISSKSNTSQHENGGYYINKDNESLYLTFGNNRIDIWNEGKHLKAFEPKVKDMKEAMSTAKEIISNINKTLDHVINKKGFDKNVEQLKNTLDKFGDKISEKDKINIEAFKLFMQEKFKDNPSKSNEGLKILIGKIPDIASGKISLPELPAIKQQVAIEVSANKKDSNLER